MLQLTLDFPWSKGEHVYLRRVGNGLMYCMQTVICLRPSQQVVPDVPPQVLHLVIHCLFELFSLFDQDQLLQKLEVFLLLLHLLGWLKTTSLAPVDCSGNVVNPSEGRWNGCPWRKELGLGKEKHG